MKQVILSKIDYSRIQKSIEIARRQNKIQANEAEKLIDELHGAQVIEPYDVPADLVTMHSIVKIVFVESGNSMELQLVYPGAANMHEKKISILSPIATALIGCRVSDEIEWLVPSGVTKLRIEEIIYQPEAEGHYHL